MAKGTVLRYRKPVQYYDIQADLIKPAGWVVRLANVIFQFLPSHKQIIEGKVYWLASIKREQRYYISDDDIPADITRAPK